MKPNCLLTWFIISAPLASLAAAPTLSYDEVAALVAQAESGDATAVRRALTTLEAHADAPLADAAKGRLLILRSQYQPFVLMSYLDLYYGMKALNAYIVRDAVDPLPRVWRAASAPMSNYVLWNRDKTRRDLEFALAAHQEGTREPNLTARCKLLLGLLAKDSGDLELALYYWREAVNLDPEGAAGREASQLLALFTG